ncbi:MAG: LysR family transcriptional regulator [Pseudomonadota bacterium]
MIDKLRAIAIFSTVVDRGTFRAAAQHLGLAPSRISDVVSTLERDLGVTLLYRSTRHLSLTHQGRILHEKARAMLAIAENGLDEISPTTDDPQGELRITAPAFTTQTNLMDVFAAFAKKYPKIALQFDFSDAPRDLIKGGFDVSIRAGWLENSDMMTRNIGGADRILVAHKNYVEKMGLPRHPSDLEDWDWIQFSVRPHGVLLTHESGETATVMGKSHVAVNSADALFQFAARGLGISGVPVNFARKGETAGDLVHLLPEWKLKRLGLHAVWPDQSRRANLTMLFVRFLAQESDW